jgi:hypothetical protein
MYLMSNLYVGADLSVEEETEVDLGIARLNYGAMTLG